MMVRFGLAGETSMADSLIKGLEEVRTSYR